MGISFSRPPFPRAQETSNAVTTAHNVFDKVGNSSTAGPIAGNMVDEKPPAITISQPTEATYTHSSFLTLNYTITDGGSGVGSITPTLNGSATATAGGDVGDYKRPANPSADRAAIGTKYVCPPGLG